jgi:site-specific DNA recombinase
MTKQYVALARVSSREQEREGFSLEVQEEALRRYASGHDGEIARFFRIAETATKPEERRAFKELLAFARKNAHWLSGLLFFKVDRAARNIFDYVELERLERDYGLDVIYTTQPTENTPAGRMMRRTLANMASFYTEQQSLDVCDGLVRRVQSGLFVGKAPYGYLNIRRDGRSIVEVNPVTSPKVRRIFDLYAYHGHTLDSLVDRLATEGHAYTKRLPRFPRSKLHAILRDRCYIGDLKFRDQWYPGSHEPLVDRATFDRVQALLGHQTYQAHELVYAGELITCGHCGSPITGELKTKKTRSGRKQYRYYRCSKYNAAGHPRVRVRERELDDQVLALFARIRIQDEKVRDWFARVLRARSQDDQRKTHAEVAELNRQATNLRSQRDQLLNLRLLEEIERETFAAKDTELRDRLAQLALRIDVCDRQQSERGEVAAKAFELSQTLADKWLKADYLAKRQLLDIVCLNLCLDDVTLVPEMRKPFDALAEGLILQNSRGDWI